MRSHLRLVLVLTIAIGACSDEHPATRPEPSAELPSALMLRLVGPARPCIERFRGHVPDPYVAEVRLTRAADGTVSASFATGAQADFNACVEGAVRGAHVEAVGLTEPLVVPFAFTFAPPAP